jgi:DNA ligase-1
VFDSPRFREVFEGRIQHAREIVTGAAHAEVIPFWRCTGKAQLLQKLDEVVAAGGEGLMLRRPGSRYERKRSNTLLKVRKKYDDEATIIAHVEGTRPGLCGALMVINKQGKVFKVGSGITEKIAHNPPPIGTIITYEYELLTKDGIPRPASFLRVRKDL